jgi:hypothetical protein
VSHGIGWFLEPCAVDCVTFARGVEPVGLAARLGSQPDRQPHRGTARHAAELLRTFGAVARVGRVDGWSFAVECGDAVGRTAAGLEAASRDGVEVVNFVLRPRLPPSTFTYYMDGAHICSFGIGQESVRGGSRPDLLLPALEDVGALPDRSGTSPVGHRRAQRSSLLAIQECFGLGLSRRQAVHGRLPMFVVRE